MTARTEPTGHDFESSDRPLLDLIRRRGPLTVADDGRAGWA